MTTTTRQRRATTRPDDLVSEIRPKTSRAKLAQMERLSIRTGRDLLWHLPRYYEDRSEITPIGDACEGMKQTFEGTITRVNSRDTGRGNMQRASLYEGRDRTGDRMNLMWFGQKHLVGRIEEGDRVLVSGTVDWSGGPSLKQPDLDIIENADGKHRPINNGMVAPTYTLTSGMAQAFMRGVIPEVLDQCRDELEREYPPGSDASLYQLLLGIHRPLDMDEATECLEALAKSELLTVQLALLQNRAERETANQQDGMKIDPQVADTMVEGLPFKLTAAQERAIADVRNDMGTAGPAMNRLIQGDVGSGKTIVAGVAAIDAATAGHQSALLAPTELLAEQHFGSITRLIGEGRPAMAGSFASHTVLEGMERPFCAALLTGSTPAKDRRQIQALLKTGGIDLLIGTHAIIQAGIEIPNLGLAIADEQHRFGVNQRAALRQGAHYLMLTATAIPRTMQLAIYRDLDVSTIDQLPEGRIPITTTVLAEHQREVAYGKVREEVEAGQQAFIVFPLIDESEGTEAKAVVEEIGHLRDHVFPNLSVGMIHGRMKQKDRDRELRAFKEGQINVLATTPVIEVGIDIPNASVMLIESAERFGIAQLHQFRGRIGRGEHASTCFVMITPGHTPAPETRRRLIAVRDSTDGMRLAEVDLSIRGHGDLSGARQSGSDHLLRAAGGYTLAMMEEQREIAERIFEADPNLELRENAGLHKQVRAMRRRMDESETDH